MSYQGMMHQEELDKAERAKVAEAERDRLREAMRRVRRVLAFLDERVVRLRRSDDGRADDYFRGRDVGELAGTEQAEDALRAALKGVE
jgi:hypothetical protein